MSATRKAQMTTISKIDKSSYLLELHDVQHREQDTVNLGIPALVEVTVIPVDTDCPADLRWERIWSIVSRSFAQSAGISGSNAAHSVKPPLEINSQKDGAV